jgi:hypothetical protein
MGRSITKRRKVLRILTDFFKKKKASMKKM